MTEDKAPDKTLANLSTYKSVFTLSDVIDETQQAKLRAFRKDIDRADPGERVK